jgi:hypothetical protein
MRPMKFVVLPVLFLIAPLLFTMSLKAQTTEDKTAGTRGTAPRTSANRYHSHVQRDGISVGAEILTPKQVHKAFVSDLNRCCIVVEFAFYLKREGPHDLSLDDFAVFVSGNDIRTKPESATVVAASLQKTASSGSGVAVEGSATVGYESGTYIDPVTGQPRKVHGVYTSTGVGVGVGNPNPAPGSTDRDRRIMEIELSLKGLPEGKVAAPVAGYLYFSIRERKKNTKYRLEYNLNSEKLVLPLS